MRHFEDIIVFYETGKNQTTLIDIYGKSIPVEVSIKALLESLCAINGLSLSAAYMNSRKVLKAKKYPPINLCYKSKISYFRVVSQKKEQLWIKFCPHLKCKEAENGQFFLEYQGRFLMNVDFGYRRFGYQFKRINKYYHNNEKCPIQELISKALKSK